MRKSFSRGFVLVVVTFTFSMSAFGQTCSGMSLGQGASLNGFVPFPASSLWNTDISTASVDPNSANIINFIGSTVTLHPDFGAGTYHNQTLGIPYQVVAGTQAKVNVTLGAFASESDPGPEPIPSNALIEGYPKPGNGDRHVLVLEKDGCWLYELYRATLKSGKWSADLIGAYFAYVEHPFAGQRSTEVSKKLADEENLLTIPGDMFGAGQERFVRLAFANVSDDRIPLVLERLERFGA